MFGNKLTLQDASKFESKEEVMKALKSYFCFSDKVKDEDINFFTSDNVKDEDIIRTAVLTVLVRKLEQDL